MTEQRYRAVLEVQPQGCARQASAAVEAVAVSEPVETSVSPQRVLMLIAVTGAASFLTPIATPANMMVMGPGEYRFGDYWKLGCR